MTMDWDRAVSRLDTEVAAVLDVATFRLLPQRTGVGVNDPGRADPGRAEFDFAGTLERQPATLPLAQRPPYDPGSPRQPPAHEAVVTAARAGMAYLPVRGDLVRDAAGTHWRIVDIVPDDGRPAFFVNRA